MATSRSLGRRSVTLRPPMKISPQVTSSSPAMSRRMVDFPHPDGPTSTMNSPSWIWSEKSSTARTSSPNCLEMFSSTISAISQPSGRAVGRGSPADRVVNGRMVDLLPHPGGGRGRCAQLVQAEQRGPHDGRHAEDGDARGRSDADDLALHAPQELGIVGLEHAATQ